jgi:molybdenum cofactor guanylyltransferase
MTVPPAWSVIVLAGGRGRRLGSVDKAAVVVDGRSSLQHLLDDLPDGVPVVVSGPERPVARPVSFRGEQPPGGGPVAGIAAALTAVGTPRAALVGADMPWSGPLLDRLVARLASTDADVVVAVTSDGRRQPLCSAWSTQGLRDCLDRLGDPRGRSLRDLLALARVHEFGLDSGESDLAADIDTPQDLHRARERGRAPRLASSDDAQADE